MLKVINERTLIPSKARVPLAQRVPLPAPFCIRIEPARVCNFRCEFCEVSLEHKQQNVKFMDYALFCSVVHQIKEAFGRVKNIVLVGLGESLLHPRIADIVREIVENNIAETVEITTNGSLLTPSMSDSLVAAGLNILRISVNGLSSEEYQQRCRANINFEEYVKNIEYFYSHRGQAKLCIKILDYMVQDPARYKQFLDIFEPICDVTVVESLTEMTPEINYKEFAGENFQFDHTQHHTTLSATQICSMPFYSFTINCNGDVQVCCRPGGPYLGNAALAHIKDIWGKSAVSFQRRMLDGVAKVPICESCTFMKYRVLPEDVLDPYVPEIKQRYNEVIKTHEGKT